ncbi:MAG TPA: hypothetical protein VEY70_01515 [Metabacillus sp.]|nr:hypothetical protein [Metabacillus sp.]
MNFKNVGKWWNDHNVKLIEIDGTVYALHGWNGEEFTDCWECVGDDLMDVGKTGIMIRPIYEEVEEDEFEIVGYQIV